MGNLGGPGSIHAVLGLASIEVRLETKALCMSKTSSHVAGILNFDLVGCDFCGDSCKSKGLHGHRLDFGAWTLLPPVSCS